MKLSQLKEQIITDLKIDKSKLDEEAANNCLKLQNYLNMFLNEQKKLVRLEKELSILLGDKLVYYKTSYKLRPETMRELEKLVMSDKEVSELNLKIANLKNLANYLKLTVENFQSRGWNIKNMIEAIKFFNGG